MGGLYNDMQFFEQDVGWFLYDCKGVLWDTAKHPPQLQ